MRYGLLFSSTLPPEWNIHRNQLVYIVSDFVELCNTVFADGLASKGYKVVVAAAKDTARAVLFEDNGIVVGEQLDGIVDIQIVLGTKGLGYDDAPQLVDFAEKACGFHSGHPFCFLPDYVPVCRKFTKLR
jgi:hypothetical protein